MEQLTRQNISSAMRPCPASVRKGYRTYRPGAEDGFTIPEVIVSICIFVISLLGLVAVIANVIHGNALSQQITTATNLAQEQTEDLKRKGYTHADLTQGNHSDPGNPLSTLYTRTWSVTDNMAGSTLATDVKTLTVTVTWNWRGSAHNMQLVTFITKK